MLYRESSRPAKVNSKTLCLKKGKEKEEEEEERREEERKQGRKREGPTFTVITIS